MDRGAWWATAHGSQRVGQDWVRMHSTAGIAGLKEGPGRSSGALRFFFPEDRHHQGALLGGGQPSPALSSPLEEPRGSARSKPGSPIAVCLHSIWWDSWQTCPSLSCVGSILAQGSNVLRGDGVELTCLQPGIHPSQWHLGCEGRMWSSTPDYFQMNFLLPLSTKDTASPGTGHFKQREASYKIGNRKSWTHCWERQSSS